MSYYSNLEVLALCDALDKVPSIRQDEHSQQKLLESVQGKRGINGVLDESRIPKRSKPPPQHDFLNLDSIIKDKKQYPQPKAYNDDLMRHQILSSSEAANSLQRLTQDLLNQSSYLQPTSTNTLASYILQYHQHNNSQLQQQARLIQKKKAIQHQHFQKTNRLPSLSTPSTIKRSSQLPKPDYSTPLSSNSNTPLHSPTSKPAKYSYDGKNSGRNSRSGTPGSQKTPHNAGTTSSDDGTQEECEFCQRIFRGPKSATHKQQHTKRIHPDSYVRKRGGIRNNI